MAIKIETGIKVYDIENEKGELLGQLKINPNDMNLFARATAFEKEMLDIVKDIDANSNSEDYTEEQMAQYLLDTDAMVKASLNDLLDDENASNVVFGNKSVFSTHNGVTFIERFLNSILPVIMEDMHKEQKKSDARVKKYTKQVK